MKDIFNTMSDKVLKYAKQISIADIINTGILLIFCLMIVLPFMYVISTSISTEKAILHGGFHLFPGEISFAAYKRIFTDVQFINSFKASAFVTLVGTFLSMLVTCTTAYVVSKDYLPYNRMISFFIYFTVLFNGGIIPLYILIKTMGLINNLWSLILPALISPWFMILLRNFFQELPDELEEAARIDGCSRIGVLFRIVLPLSLPALATISLFYMVHYWNSWFLALIFITDRSKWPMQVLLREIIQQAQNIRNNQSVSASELRQATLPESLKMATVIVTAFPIMCVYPFLQKYFAKGLLIGAIKG